MGREESPHRFPPERWVTLRDTGEHVKVEMWSGIAAAYRVRSRKRGLLFATEEELDAIVAHPEEHLGKYWHRCRAPGCGAPLTPELPLCVRCQALTCTCGRCGCARPARTAARSKAPRKKAAPRPPV
jgi:hypothetical protein